MSRFYLRFSGGGSDACGDDDGGDDDGGDDGGGDDGGGDDGGGGDYSGDGLQQTHDRREVLMQRVKRLLRLQQQHRVLRRFCLGSA